MASRSGNPKPYADPYHGRPVPVLESFGNKLNPGGLATEEPLCSAVLTLIRT